MTRHNGQISRWPECSSWVGGGSWSSLGLTRLICRSECRFAEGATHSWLGLAVSMPSTLVASTPPTRKAYSHRSERRAAEVISGEGDASAAAVNVGGVSLTNLSKVDKFSYIVPKRTRRPPVRYDTLKPECLRRSQRDQCWRQRDLRQSRLRVRRRTELGRLASGTSACSTTSSSPGSW